MRFDFRSQHLATPLSRSRALEACITLGLGLGSDVCERSLRGRHPWTSCMSEMMGRHCTRALDSGPRSSARERGYGACLPQHTCEPSTHTTIIETRFLGLSSPTTDAANEEACGSVADSINYPRDVCRADPEEDSPTNASPGSVAFSSPLTHLPLPPLHVLKARSGARHRVLRVGDDSLHDSGARYLAPPFAAIRSGRYCSLFLSPGVPARAPKKMRVFPPLNPFVDKINCIAI
jgi:hypothetical protein